MTNRLHTFTRWPNDPGERFDLAVTDLTYVEAMLLCGVPMCLSLSDVRVVAMQQLELAKRELNEA